MYEHCRIFFGKFWDVSAYPLVDTWSGQLLAFFNNYISPILLVVIRLCCKLHINLAKQIRCVVDKYTLLISRGRVLRITWEKVVGTLTNLA
jgi:hypothetical protein